MRARSRPDVALPPAASSHSRRLEPMKPQGSPDSAQNTSRRRYCAACPLAAQRLRRRQHGYQARQRGLRALRAACMHPLSAVQCTAHVGAPLCRQPWAPLAVSELTPGKLF